MPRSSPFIDRWFRPSPEFERFVNTPTALVLAALMGLGAAAGCALAVWRGHWIDAVVYGLLTVALGAWLVIRLHRRHGDSARHS